MKACSSRLQYRMIWYLKLMVRLVFIQGQEQLVRRRDEGRLGQLSRLQCQRPPEDFSGGLLLLGVVQDIEGGEQLADGCAHVTLQQRSRRDGPASAAAVGRVPDTPPPRPPRLPGH